MKKPIAAKRNFLLLGVPLGFFFSRETHRERKKIHEGGKKKHGKTYNNIDTRRTTSDDDR